MTKKTKVLITGSAGFIGSHLSAYLNNKGFSVYDVDDLSGGFLRNVVNKKFFKKLDLREREKTAQYIKELKPEIIFHLAADATEGRSQFTPFSAVDCNLVAYMNVLVPAIKNGLKKMILMSSMSVYGAQQVPFRENLITQPEDVYGTSKAAMETVTRVMSNVYGFKYVVIRPHNVYGPKQNLSDPYRNVVGIFINRLLNGKNFFIYGDGEQKRAFSYIDEIVEGTSKAAFSRKCEGKTINLGGDKAITLNDLAKIVLEEFFAAKKIPAHFMPEYFPARPQEVKYAYSNHDIAKKLINFKEKTTLRKGIKIMIEWAKSMGPQKFRYLSEFDLESNTTPKIWKDRLL